MKFAFKNALLFAVFIIIGTLSHESGHYIIARLWGFHHAYIAYDRTYYGANSNLNPADYDKIEIWVTLGGPMITMIIGTIGLLLCLRNRGYKVLNWKIHLYIILALFWGREVSGLPIPIMDLLQQHPPHFGGDEGRLSSLLHLPNGFLTFATGISGFVICSYIFFFIKKELRLTFIVSALVGTGLGVCLWWGILGPRILPYYIK